MWFSRVICRERQNILLHICQVADFWAYQYFFYDSENSEWNDPNFVQHIFAYFAKISWFWHTFLGIFLNISSILPQICSFLTVFGEYFSTDKILTKIWDIPKFPKKIETLKTWGKKFLKKCFLVVKGQHWFFTHNKILLDISSKVNTVLSVRR